MKDKEINKFLKDNPTTSLENLEIVFNEKGVSVNDRQELREAFKALVSKDK